MPESRVRVLVVNPKLNQAVGIKNAIDAVPGFEARSFTSPINALEFARTTPLDAAVLDLAIRSPNLGETTVALRKLNPKIKLILTNAPAEALSKLRADGEIALPARARDIEPLLRDLFPPAVNENRPPTPVRRPQELMLPQQADTTTPPVPPAQPHDPSQPDPFQRIAAEEPPIPSAVEGGTVREAVRALLPRTPADESMFVIEITPIPSDTDEGQPLDHDEVAETSAEEPAAPPTPAPVPDEPVLAPDDTRPPTAPMSFDDSDADLDEPLGESITPQPVTMLDVAPLSVDADDEDDDEPEFLAAELSPDDEAGSAAGVPDEDTPPVAIPEQPLVIPGVRRPPKPKTEQPPAATDAPSIDIPGVRRPPKPKTEQPAAMDDGALSRSQPQRGTLSPAELRRALMLTHEQLGTAAAALILTQGDEVLAHSGEMPTQEIEELQAVINGDWDAHGTQARIRYITLPTSRQEYMLHSRMTANGYTLSMAFAGDLPVQDIRTQSDAVASTLESFRGSDDDAGDSALSGSRLPFTAIWMLNNPDDPLTADIAQAIVLEFDRELREFGWPIHAMNVHADFVYVFCDVQTTYLASDVLADLKRISAQAACARRPDWDPDELWADAYMALMPGRELGSDEVQSFLNFTRSRLHRKAQDEES